MHNKLSTTLVTLWVNRIVAVLVAALIPLLPAFLKLYADVRSLDHSQYLAVLIGYYCCVPVVAAALWNLDKLLRNILRDVVFTRENVRCIRLIRWCCALISLICLPAALVYYPLLFMVIIMAFLCLVVSVVVRVMDTAVTIREENDLTI